MQQPLELILTRQWASNLNCAVWLYNESGELIFFNEACEKLLALHFVKPYNVEARDLPKIFKYNKSDGSPLTADELPINIALSKHHPAHGLLRIRALNGEWKTLESTAFPIIGQGGKNLGAISIFWETT